MQNRNTFYWLQLFFSGISGKKKFGWKGSFQTAALLFFIPAFIFSQGKKPDWVERRPQMPAYYIGIAAAPKTGTAQEYMQRAKDAALNDIAQQIVVNINASQMSKVSEKMEGISEEYLSQVATSTKAELEEVETVDSWSGENDYWIFLRLSKETYARLKAEKIRKASALALDLYTKAKAAEKGNSLGQALQFYIQSLSAVEKYISEPLEVSYNGAKIFLGNELFGAVQQLLNQIELKAKTPKIEAQVGVQVKKPVEILAVSVEGEKPLGNIPVRFSFLRGAGDIISSSKTNSSGIASTQIAKITSTDKLQILKAEIDLMAMVNNSPVFETLMKGFTIPAARVMVNVVNLAVFFEVEESILGKTMRIPRIEPVIKNSLSSQGYAFVDDVSKANLMVTIKADGRDGGEFQGLYTVYVDANLSVTDLNSGQEIYKTSLNNVKGISINYDKAGTKAYDEIAEQIKKNALPKILEQLRK